MVTKNKNMQKIRIFTLFLALVMSITNLGFIPKVLAQSLVETSSIETGIYVLKSENLDFSPTTFTKNKVGSTSINYDTEISSLSKWNLTVNNNKVKLQDENGIFIGPSSSGTGLVNKEYEWTIVKNSDGTITFESEANRAFALQNLETGAVYKNYALSNSNKDTYSFSFRLYTIEDTETGSQNPSEPDVPENPETGDENIETENPNFDILPIKDIRDKDLGSIVGIKATVISKENSWGGNGFHVEDETGYGIYVYPKTDLNVKIGDVVEFQGKLSSYSNNLQIENIEDLKILGQESTPKSLDLKLSDLDKTPLHILYTLKNVTVEDLLEGSYKTAEFIAVDENKNELSIRLDNRSGYDYDKLSTKVGNGDKINVTGILSVYNNKFQLLPFDETHFEVLEKYEGEPISSFDEVSIAEIQGEGYESPYINKSVFVKEAVVTYVSGKNNFYIQDIVPDDNKNTSDGIEVYKSNHGLKVGDKVSVLGKVVEFYGQGYDEKKETDLTISQISASEIKVLGTAKLPEPIKLTDSTIPKNAIKESDEFNTINNSLDFWESVEGMLVTVEDAYILGPQKYGDIYILPGDTTENLNKLGGFTLKPNQNPNIISVYTGNRNLITKGGDRIDGSLTGPVSYQYSQYKIITDSSTFEIIEGNSQREVSPISLVDDRLTIASYNIENFTAAKETDDQRVETIAKSIVNNLNSPDIITLVEVQDDDGEADTGTTTAEKTGKRLVDSILQNGGPKYVFVDNVPENNHNGGAPGANIRVAFLYNPNRVTLKSTDIIGENLSVFEDTRKSIVGNFVFNGHDVMVIGNHFNSKGGDQPLFGVNQPAYLGSVSQRTELAKVVNQYVKDKLNENPNLNVVVTGDLNDFEFNVPVKTLGGSILTNLVDLHDYEDRFSYYYQGNSQTLDHLLVANSMVNRVRFDMVHINSLYMQEHGRASDHDPILVQISFPEEIYKDEEYIINFETIKIEDENLPYGTSKVLTKGVNGKNIITYKYIYVDGKETKKELIKTTIIKEPINEVIAVGTKVVENNNSQNENTPNINNENISDIKESHIKNVNSTNNKANKISSNSVSNPNTSDSMNSTAYIGVVIISSIVLIIITKKKRTYMNK